MLPTCKSKDGTTKGGHASHSSTKRLMMVDRVLVRAVQDLTGLTVDHYVVVDFTGFKDIVNALDGVEVCLKKDVHDKDAKLNLTAGEHIVRGDQALAFVRARKQVGDGSDLSHRTPARVPLLRSEEGDVSWCRHEPNTAVPSSRSGHQILDDGPSACES